MLFFSPLAAYILRLPTLLFSFQAGRNSICGEKKRRKATQRKATQRLATGQPRITSTSTRPALPPEPAYYCPPAAVAYLV
ncbi:hypothetical protein M440DRAFT_1009364 [Trichoderma longibrachiatum ATCC 18648]|uniref:Secreted protein n=1 Tax=Trichoderma longibrachiatum ATCC 18648 TaxID=983965 RepID=A0A2T4CHX8_TRILO|nr:hypothetical protein M440DRAFT_1009364 [Trichoderma longibrachiatum ATCC 18648]